MSRSGLALCTGYQYPEHPTSKDFLHANLALITHPWRRLFTALDIETLYLAGAVINIRPVPVLIDAEGQNVRKKLPPFRQHSEDVVKDEDWIPLLRYPTHQTSRGKRITLSVSGNGVHTALDVQQQTRDLVKRFLWYSDANSEFPSIIIQIDYIVCA